MGDQDFRLFGVRFNSKSLSLRRVNLKRSVGVGSNSFNLKKNTLAIGCIRRFINSKHSRLGLYFGHEIVYMFLEKFS